MSFSKAVFIDRDGTIIVDAHYLSDPKDVVLLPKAADALELLSDAGFLLFLFSNQSGVGRGFFTIETVHRCNQRMIDLLGFKSDFFTDICMATESPDEPSVYRKPNPRFIIESLAKHGLDPRRSWMVGDKTIDAQTGLNAGINAALLGGKNSRSISNVSFYPTLYAFAKDACAQLAPP